LPLPDLFDLKSHRSRTVATAAGLVCAVIAVALAAIILGRGHGGNSSNQAAAVTPQADEAQPNRANCDEIVAAAGFQSDAERDWFSQNCPGGMTTATAPEPSPTPEPEPAVIEGSAPGPVKDRLVISRLGIDAPVQTSRVPANGQMGDPDGPYDVVWYDFSNFAGFGGYPGRGGNAVFAGHVDYHPNIQAVFWTLRNARAGDVIDYYTESGQHLQYTVEWKKDTGPNDDFATYVSQSGQDMITLITCDGVFNSVTRHYDQRSVVRAVRSS
jgi:LPXTG-site transpeptidase (sortase) family protein